VRSFMCVAKITQTPQQRRLAVVTATSVRQLIRCETDNSSAVTWRNAGYTQCHRWSP